MSRLGRGRPADHVIVPALLTVRVSDTDSITSTEVVSLYRILPTGETSIGLDSQSIIVNTSNSDTLSGIETVPGLAAVTPGTDVIGGVDSGVVNLSDNDLVSGIDSSSLSTTLTSPEILSGVESNIVLVFSSESMTGVDTGIPSTPVSDTEIMNSVESFSISVSISNFDLSQTTVSTQFVNAFIPGVDTASAVEAVFPIATSDTEVGLGTDVELVTVQDRELLGGLDTLINIGIAAVELGNSSENAVVAIAVFNSDSSTGLDSSSLINSFSDSDVGMGVDRQLVGQLPVADFDSLHSNDNIYSVVAQVQNTELLSLVDFATLKIISSDPISIVDDSSVKISNSDVAHGLDTNVNTQNSSSDIVASNESNVTTSLFNSGDVATGNDNGSPSPQSVDQVVGVDNGLTPGSTRFSQDTISSVEGTIISTTVDSDIVLRWNVTIAPTTHPFSTVFKKPSVFARSYSRG